MHSCEVVSITVVNLRRFTSVNSSVNGYPCHTNEADIRSTRDQILHAMARNGSVWSQFVGVAEVWLNDRMYACFVGLLTYIGVTCLVKTFSSLQICKYNSGARECFESAMQVGGRRALVAVPGFLERSKMMMQVQGFQDSIGHAPSLRKRPYTVFRWINMQWKGNYSLCITQRSRKVHLQDGSCIIFLCRVID